MSEIGRIWSETVLTIPKIQRRTYISNALKEHEDDPYVIMTAAKLFWSLNKVNSAREWMKRAVAKNGDIGDFWALYYIFEMQNGSEEQRKEVIVNCTRANLRHGEVWPTIRKQKENRRKSVEDILLLTAEQLKDVMVDFSKWSVCCKKHVIILFLPSPSQTTAPTAAYPSFPSAPLPNQHHDPRFFLVDLNLFHADSHLLDDSRCFGTLPTRTTATTHQRHHHSARRSESRCCASNTFATD